MFPGLRMISTSHKLLGLTVFSVRSETAEAVEDLWRQPFKWHMGTLCHLQFKCGCHQNTVTICQWCNGLRTRHNKLLFLINKKSSSWFLNSIRVPKKPEANKKASKIFWKWRILLINTSLNEIQAIKLKALSNAACHSTHWHLIEFFFHPLVPFPW